MKQSGTEGKRNTLRRWLTPITVAAIALLLVLNVGLAALLQYKSLYVDLTPEGLYSLTDAMIEECDKIESDITITFCDDPDRLLSNFETRYVYVLATELANRYDNIDVETYNLTLNPTALDKFRTTSASRLKSNFVIVSSGDRYRIYNASNFWVSDADDKTAPYFSFDGEFTFATAFFSLTALTTPVAYFVYGHGEGFYVSPDDTEHADLLAYSNEDYAAFYELLQAEGLKIDYVNLAEAGGVPEDCALLIVNGPKTDLVTPSDALSYYERSEAEMIDRYLSTDSGAMMVFKDPDYSLESLEQLTEKWGIVYGGADIVKDEVQSLGDAVGTAAELYNTRLLADYTSNEGSYSWGVYKDIASIDSAPAVVLDRTGTVSCAWASTELPLSGVTESALSYSDFFVSSKNAELYSIGDNFLNGEADIYTLAAMSTKLRVDSTTSQRYYSYLFCAATTNLTTNEYLTDFSCANYDVMFSLVRYISGINSYASTELGSTSMNSDNIGGKRLVHSAMDTEDFIDYSVGGKKFSGFTQSSLTLWTIIVVLVPAVAVPIVGAAVCIRRRFL